jgi:hypothetical protein
MSSMMAEIQMIPSTNFTNATYQMYTYLNISNFHDEQDFLLKFTEKSSLKKEANKNKLHTRSRQAPMKLANILNLASNVTYFHNNTSNKLFNLIDVNSDGFADFYDFGHFYVCLYLFQRFDPNQKGKILAGDIYEKFIDYSDFPRISSELRSRAKRFNQINQDSYLDFYNTLTMLRIDDLVALYTRKSDKSTLYEVELKRIFTKTNLRFVNDGLLNRCLRGMDAMNVPKYDWECAFMHAITENINYIESASSYNTAVMNNITLSNTVFYNVDQTLPKFF